ncbi:hypothetical protein CFR71_05520 [Novacetimonas pomaceti]|uniref:Endolytic peptidoglycan transglycosylase RlpA n=2 Tax=Novacetimonas pomaceti TaxID=2021998 RepID=A0A318Q9G8_9PROT|nr:hypothetical protein CFR71_05520 [Novacetimonas pomaceti]
MRRKMPDLLVWGLSCLLTLGCGMTAGMSCAHARHATRHAVRHARAAHHHLRRLPPVAPMQSVSSTWSQHGLASWYGTHREIGHRTASGDIFDPGAMTAAHRQLPLGTRVRIRAVATGRSVIVTINDRGPYRGNRIIDLSPAAAREIGLLDRGTTAVDIMALPPEEAAWPHG